MNIFSFMEILDAVSSYSNVSHEGQHSLVSPQHIINESLSGLPHSFPNFLAFISYFLPYESVLSSAPSFRLKTSCSFGFSHFPRAMKPVTALPLKHCTCLFAYVNILKNT